MKTQVTIVLVQEGVPPELQELVDAGQALALLNGLGLVPRGALLRTKSQCDSFAAAQRPGVHGLLVLIGGAAQARTIQALIQTIGGANPAISIAVAGGAAMAFPGSYCRELSVDAVFLADWIAPVAMWAAERDRGIRTSEAASALWRDENFWQLNNPADAMPDINRWPQADATDFRLVEITRLYGSRAPLRAGYTPGLRTLFSPSIPAIANGAIEDFFVSRAPESIIREATHLVTTSGAATFAFVDDFFPVDPEWTALFCRRWSAHVGLPFSIVCAAEHMDPMRIRLLRGAGLHLVRIRLESGDEALRGRFTTLNRMNEDVRTAFRLCRDEGILCECEFMVGAPGENSEQRGKTVELAHSSGCHNTHTRIWTRIPEYTGRETLAELLARTVEDVPHESEMSGEPFARESVCDEIARMDSKRRASALSRQPNAIVDGLADFPKATVKSPHRRPARIEKFHSAKETHNVIALPVPSSITWEIPAPRHAEVSFGILMKGALAGERARLPIGFSVFVRADGHTYRIFQKVLIQALDPDSRQWHWFRIPLPDLPPAQLEVVFEARIFGKEEYDGVEGRNLWAGYARIFVTTAAKSVGPGLGIEFEAE